MKSSPASLSQCPAFCGVAFVSAVTSLSLVVSLSPAVSGPVDWVDWASTGTQTVNGNIQGNNVVFTGEYLFANTSSGANYYVPSAPYLGSTVSNPPPDSDIIAISRAGQRSLSFSQPVTGLLLAYVSINGNTYTFDHDFNLVSNAPGYWGTGSVSKVDNNNGTWSLVAMPGEPHGVIQFPDTLNHLNWNVAVHEYWNGFTVATPVPGPLGAVGAGASFLFGRRLRQRIQAGRAVVGVRDDGNPRRSSV
jgi:hypothetical protein